MQNYSVLMSVYHKEKPEYLRQAIESIQAQTLSTNDFVLVCDGPLNEPLDSVIAAKQQEMGESLNVVRLAKNGGLGNALNEGIKHCKNELVARIGGFMNENDRTTLEQAIYEEMELTPEMIRSIRTLCGVCLCSFVESKAFKIAIVPSADRSMDTCTVCQTRRGHDYVVMNR